MPPLVPSSLLPIVLALSPLELAFEVSIQFSGEEDESVWSEFELLAMESEKLVLHAFGEFPWLFFGVKFRKFIVAAWHSLVVVPSHAFSCELLSIKFIDRPSSEEEDPDPTDGVSFEVMDDAIDADGVEESVWFVLLSSLVCISFPVFKIARSLL